MLFSYVEANIKILYELNFGELLSFTCKNSLMNMVMQVAGKEKEYKHISAG